MQYFLIIKIRHSLKYQSKNPSNTGVFTLVTLVRQSWNSVIKGLEQIDIAFDDFIIEEDL